jgi:hypothetical protein
MPPRLFVKTKTVPSYQQNDAHHDCYKYCKITRSDYILRYLIDSGQITGIFLDGNDNGAESIWAVQFSINDGTNAGRVSYVTGLNSPHGTSLYGCCGFIASQNMVECF